MPSEPLRILLVDDHPLVRNGLRALLSSMTEMMVVGEATNGEEAIIQAAELQPDIILMDLHMPGLNGIEATRRILQVSPRIGILVLTMLEDDASVFAAMRAGARGYLLKGADQADVLRAIRVVAHGEAIFSPSIAQRLMQYFANMQPMLPKAAFPDLTDREREILGLTAPRPSCVPSKLDWGRDRQCCLPCPLKRNAFSWLLLRVERANLMLLSKHASVQKAGVAMLTPISAFSAAPARAYCFAISTCLVPGSTKQTVPESRIIGAVFPSRWYIIGRVAGAISPKTAPIIQLDR